jgi:signal transduction histidine kinase
MTLLAHYRAPGLLPETLNEAAARLAQLVDGIALLYRADPNDGAAPSAWAGFDSAEAARSAGSEIGSFRTQVASADRALQTAAPAGPSETWGRAAGGLYGFPLRFQDRMHGVAVVGFPGGWPEDRGPEVEAIVRQLSLVLDHHAAMNGSAKDSSSDPDELLQLSEQLLSYEVELKDANERIVKVERARDELVEKLSHELRIPVHGMIERVISVLTAEHDALSPASRQALRHALDDGATFLRTLQHMLDLWRLKQAPLPIESQEVNLYEVVEEAVFNVQDRMQAGVEIVRNIPANLPQVRTDLAKLNQVLFLLLDNAVKFTPSGSVELEIQLEEGQLLCTVKDTGIGIAPQDQKQIFEEFFQVDSPSDGRYRGAGLGLPLARSLVERMGGAVSVSSEIGRGSCFEFTLPVKTS